MNSLSVRLGVILFIIGLVIFGNIEVWGADWKLLGTTEESEFFYDRVWVEHIYNEKGVNTWVKKLGEQFENLDYCLELVEFDCPKRKMRLLSAHYYSKDGNIIQSSEFPKPSWWSVRPEKIDGSLYKGVCKSLAIITSPIKEVSILIWPRIKSSNDAFLAITRNLITQGCFSANLFFISSLGKLAHFPS